MRVQARQATTYWLRPLAAGLALLATLFFIGARPAGSALQGGHGSLLFGVLYEAVFFTRRLRRNWQESPPSRLRLWLAATFCTPAFAIRFYRRWLNRGLERNPIGWLEKRRWSSRIISWTWLAVTIALASAGLTYSTEVLGDIMNLLRVLTWGLALSVVAVAAGSFSRERAAGMMELLLISPLKEWQIITGRLRGLWGQFLPSAALLLGLWFFLIFSLRFAYFGAEPLSLICYAGMFLSLPAIGLYCSLRHRSYLSSITATLLLGLAIPWLVTGVVMFVVRLPTMQVLLQRFFSLNHFVLPFLLEKGGLPMVIQLTLAVIVVRALHRRLTRRQFSHHQG
jgi:ABC-type transport system involved in multi-copper enzyme maturation permease subunit